MQNLTNLMTLTNIVMTLATIVMAIATVFVAKSSSASNRIIKSQSLPIINFSVDRNERPAWIIKNIGKGTANILVAHKKSNGEIEEPIRDYNVLSPGDYYRILWNETPNIFIAQYQDVYSNHYTVECGKSINKFEEKWLYNNWDKKERRQFWQMLGIKEVSK